MLRKPGTRVRRTDSGTRVPAARACSLACWCSRSRPGSSESGSWSGSWSGSCACSRPRCPWRTGRWPAKPPGCPSPDRRGEERPGRPCRAGGLACRVPASPDRPPVVPVRPDEAIPPPGTRPAAARRGGQDAAAGTGGSGVRGMAVPQGRAQPGWVARCCRGPERRAVAVARAPRENGLITSWAIVADVSPRLARRT